MRLRHRLDANRDEIRTSLALYPDDFAGREQLWMDRHAMQRQLETTS